MERGTEEDKIAVAVFTFKDKDGKETKYWMEWEEWKAEQRWLLGRRITPPTPKDLLYQGQPRVYRDEADK